MVDLTKAGAVRALISMHIKSIRERVATLELISKECQDWDERKIKRELTNVARMLRDVDVINIKSLAESELLH